MSDLHTAANNLRAGERAPNEPQPVDVLAVLRAEYRRIIGRWNAALDRRNELRAGRFGGHGLDDAEKECAALHSRERAIAEVRAAVAELLEAVADDLTARNTLRRSHVTALLEKHGISLDHPVALAKLRKATDTRLRAALARIGGAA